MMLPTLAHERVVSTVGRRSGLPMTVAVHSTALGTALGGCRLWSYEQWGDGLADAMRLSAAMTLKCAVAGLATGGGKSVIALRPGQVLTPEERRKAFLDLGDLVESFEGAYRTAEDVGTSTADILVVRERTEYAIGLPADRGGIGEPAAPTAAGVYASVQTTLDRLGLETADLRVTVIGLGQVGSRVAQALADEGAALTVTDLDPARRAFAEKIGAEWVPLADAMTRPTDVVVPAGVGGLLTAEAIAALDCKAVVGPANNQLADADGDEQLAERGILWAPDFVVNAGGALAAILTELEGLPPAEVDARIAGIGRTLADIYDTASADGVTPQQAAVRIAERRLADAASGALPVMQGVES
ncbi:Glu/Leu/Phe/Val dehydrogenase dimerization domain-containing protein [Microbacterium sp. RD1]|uniref:Glu/Leu/Phe/Val dehydrogenase family protein n=1 Tax=Microbacterium sp. RD1 TaxID=3457313 RepID=UPI003FA5620C